MRLLLFFGKKTFELEVYEAQSTTYLRKLIFEKTKVPPERQQILGLKGGVLRSDGPLSAFNIYDGQKIVLMELKEAPASNVPAAVAPPIAAVLARAKKNAPRGAVVSTNMTECLNFMELPGELQSMVITFLSATQVAATASVSKTWRMLVDDEVQWKDRFARRYHEPHIAHPPSSWKALYALRYRSELNARNRHFRYTALATVPASCICAASVESETVYLGCVSNIVQVELPSKTHSAGRKLRTLKGHSDRITALCLKQNCLISGGNSGNILLWDTQKDPTPLPWHRRSVEFVGTLRGNQRAVTDLYLDDNVTTLITSSDDGVIVVHDLKSGNVIHTYAPENAGAVEGLAVSGNRLLSIYSDRFTRIWNLSAEGDEPVSSHGSPVMNSGPYVNMHFCERLGLLTIAAQFAVEVWDARVMRLLHVIRQAGVQCVCNDGRFLWMGCANGLFLHYEDQVILIDPTFTDIRALSFRGHALIAAGSRGVNYYDFSVKPIAAPVVQQEPVFSDEMLDNDAPDEMPEVEQHHNDDHGDAGGDDDDDENPPY